jgi:hypothetical protein
MDNKEDIRASMRVAYSRRDQIVGGLGNSASDLLGLGFDIRNGRRGFLLHRRGVGVSLVEGRKARVGGVLGGVLGQVVLEFNLELGLLQSIVPSEKKQY